MDSLESQILQYISTSQTRVTFRCLQKRFSFRESRPLKKAVARLVRSGRVSYTYEFGSSYLAISFDRPVVVSERVVLKPPHTVYDTGPEQALVVLERGGSFGLGDHPTTRLAIQLIDKLLLARRRQLAKASFSALDLGTGSGVLAIVAAKLGVDSVMAIDTDPCAVFEARSNVRLNGLENQILVCQEGDAFIDERFDFVMANLRTPTLLDLVPQIEKTTAMDCGLVLSGIQLEERPQIRTSYESAGFTSLESCSEKNWCALSFVRGDFWTPTSGGNPIY